MTVMNKSEIYTLLREMQADVLIAKRQCDEAVSHLATAESRLEKAVFKLGAEVEIDF